MSVDQLRAGFDRLAERVVPMEDPFTRLVARRRSRARRRIGIVIASAVAVAAAVVSVPLAFPSTPEFDGYPVSSPWVWKMLDAPTRGNFATDELGRLTEAFADGPAKLSEVKVLLAYRHADMMQAVVAYHSDTKALVLARSAPIDASLSDLAESPGPQGVPADPFLVTYSEVDAAKGAFVGLAPPGCDIDTSLSATVGPDGSWQRSYKRAPTDGFVINHNSGPAQMWRVTCDGVVREVRPARAVAQVRGNAYSGSGSARGNPDPQVEMAAALTYNALHFATGAGAGTSAAIWGGEVPGWQGEGPAALRGPAPGSSGILVLQFGPNQRASVALEPEGSHVLTPSASSQGALASTGVADGSGVYAVRIPKREPARVVLSDRVLIVAPETAVEAQALDAQGNVVASGQLQAGVGVLTLALGRAQRLRVLNTLGPPVESAFAELPSGPRVFGDQLVNNWN